MFDFLKVSSPPLVGIDISSSTIKVLELSRLDNQYTVETYGTELLPPQSVQEKTIKEIDTVAKTIRKLLKRVGATRKCASIAVSGPSVITRVIQLAAEFNDAMIAEQIEADAVRNFPYPLEEIYYDFEVIGPSTRNPELKDILLASSRIETVDIRVATINEAELTPTVVDIEMLAVERAFKLVVNHLPAQGKGLNFALIDIGSTNTVLYVIRDLRTIYSREQAFGGKHLTDEIQRRYGLGAEEAIVAQRYGGLPEDYITEVLTPFKETIIQQINRALQVFFSSSDESEIQYIVLAGGVAMMPGLDTLIQSRLKTKTFIANPFSGMKLSSKVSKNNILEEASGFMVACGLALRTFEDE